LPAEGAPIQTNDYNIDLYQGLEATLDRRLRQRFREQPRFHVLITTSIVISGPAEDAVGIESMLDRAVQRSGEDASVSPRLGIETELVPHWLHLRGGSYIEPSRYRSNPKGSRMHGTFCFDQKVLPWDVFGIFPEGTEWRVSGSLDASRSYLGWGIGLGVWR